MEKKRKYCPSNGTEGMYFIDEYCMNCIHEKWSHTQKDGDAQCGILSQSFIIADADDPAYPEEWTYDENGRPICTAWKKWDWGNSNDEGGLNEPLPVIPEDPNQLCMPFIFDEIGIKKIEKELVG